MATFHRITFEYYDRLHRRKQEKEASPGSLPIRMPSRSSRNVMMRATKPSQFTQPRLSSAPRSDLPAARSIGVLAQLRSICNQCSKLCAENTTRTTLAKLKLKKDLLRSLRLRIFIWDALQQPLVSHHSIHTFMEYIHDLHYQFDLNLLSWWTTTGLLQLCQMAHDLLPIPATSCAVERASSSAGYLPKDSRPS